MGRNIPSRSNDLTMDMNVSDVALSTFIGENPGDESGWPVSIIGDVNGDGYDDMAISSLEFDERRGKIYLVFGHSSGWSMDVDLSEADASFSGENVGDSTCNLAGAGDVNGDGYDDLIIGAYMYGGVGGNKGKVYLIFGKASGWTKNVVLSNADASFIGEAVVNAAGASLSGAGDVNGDGFDDFIIGAPVNDEGGTNSGQTYLILGKSSGWGKNASLSGADASFIGDADDHAGDSVSGAGDVNNDGFDDIMIGTFYGSEVYLVLGSMTGWAMDMYLSSEADASFIGEGAEPTFGREVSGGGDVNGDGLDDILISARGNDEGGYFAGQTYLIFGRSSGWSMGMDMSKANASFIGESEQDSSGNSFCGSGDVDGDGYDDLLISAYHNEEGGTSSGQTYLILGRSTGWNLDTNLTTADASFIGESERDSLGMSVSNSGDVNGDGCDDILIGASFYGETNDEIGKTYLVSMKGFSDPTRVYSVDVKNMGGIGVTSADIGEKVLVEMTGLDRDPLNQDRARVNFTYGSKVLRILLDETDLNTGIYRGTFTMPISVKYLDYSRFSAYVDQSKYKDILIDYPYRPKTINSIGVFKDSECKDACDKADLSQTVTFEVKGIDASDTRVDKAFAKLTSDKDQSINELLILGETGASTGIYRMQFKVPNSMVYFENITITSQEDPSKQAEFMVHTPVQIRTEGPLVDAVEDEEYRMGFYNFGYNIATWTFSTDAYWLSWDDENKEIFGIPRNNDVGEDVWEVMLKAEDSYGNGFDLNYLLSVINAPPVITTEPILEVKEGEEYHLDLESDDDGQGEISWYLYSTSQFLVIDKGTGILTGTPIEGEAGVYLVNVQVQDGNGGSGSLIYNLTVLGQNDRPRITTTDINQVEQNTPFRRDYEVFDPDEGDAHIWSLRTDADWLTMECETGVLYGTPDGFDVGDWIVNITVTDTGGLNDSREFTLKVLDAKDKPVFDDVPADIELVHGTEYSFDVNATDPDVGSILVFSIDTNPDSNMSINQWTGEIHWKASYRSMPDNGKGMIVTVKVTDGELFSVSEFTIIVTPTLSPTVEILSPMKGSRTLSEYSMLTWSGTDPDDEPLTYTLYLADSESYVSAKRSQDIEAQGIIDSYYNLTGLTQGRTYYWTVIPDDDCTSGTCSDGVFSFRVNNRPTIGSIDDQTAKVGEEFDLKIEGIDDDQDDTLTYEVLSGPKGMTIRGGTGMVVWTPEEGQEGIHKVRVRVSDGYEPVERTFDVEVKEAGHVDNGLLIGLGAGILVLVIVILLIYIFVIKGRGGGNEVEEDEDANRMREEMVQKQRDREWEDAHTRPSDHQVVSDIQSSSE